MRGGRGASMRARRGRRSARSAEQQSVDPGLRAVPRGAPLGREVLARVRPTGARDETLSSPLGPVLRAAGHDLAEVQAAPTTPLAVLDLIIDRMRNRSAVDGAHPPARIRVRQGSEHACHGGLNLAKRDG